MWYWLGLVLVGCVSRFGICWVLVGLVVVYGVGIGWFGIGWFGIGWFGIGWFGIGCLVLVGVLVGVLVAVLVGVLVGVFGWGIVVYLSEY